MMATWAKSVFLLACLGVVSAGLNDTKIWDVWSSSPDAWPMGSRQQRLQLEGKLRFSARKGDIIGFRSVLMRGRFMNPPLDINGLDKDNRTALHWAAISGYGGDLEQVNSTRIRNPQYANASFTWTEAEYEWTFLYQAYKASLEYPDFKPKGSPTDYVYSIPWCNIQGNVCPQPLDMDARDNSGTSPIHEAVLHDNILTVRTLADMQETGIMASTGVLMKPSCGLIPSGKHAQDDQFVRNMPMLNEWQFGWSLWNWISLIAKDDIKGGMTFRTATMNEIKTGLEVVKLNPGKGMTVFDYAVIYERVGIASWLLSKNPEYKTVTSNWGEYPIHKAAYFGFVDILKLLLPTAADCESVLLTALGQETPVLYASLGGHIKFLEYLSTMCPAQFARTLITPASTTLTWRSQIPCDTSVYTVAKAREYCGSTENGAAGGCPGWYRWRCSNDRNKSCQFHEDCSENGDKGASCDEIYAPADNMKNIVSQAHLMPFANLNRHWQTCVLVCPSVRRPIGCGATFDGSPYLGFKG